MHEFDFIIGADGAGSAVRKALAQQVRGFSVETDSYPNQCIAAVGTSAEQLVAAVRSLFEHRAHMLRAVLTSRLGLSIFDQAKSADVSYSEVRRKAERLWPLWA